MLISLLPDLLTLLDIVGGVDGVVNAKYDDQGPGKGHEDAVEVQRLGVMRLAPGEWVVWHFDGGSGVEGVEVVMEEGDGEGGVIETEIEIT